jgi:hypothetical protein
VPAVDSPNFRPARPPRLVSGTSTSMGGFPFRERGSGVSNRYNLDYCVHWVVSWLPCDGLGEARGSEWLACTGSWLLDGVALVVAMFSAKHIAKEHN